MQDGMVDATFHDDAITYNFLKTVNAKECLMAQARSIKALLRLY
jgi:hypothetical protein